MAEFGWLDEVETQDQYGFLDEGGSDPTPQDLDRLFASGRLANPTPEQALQIQDHRRSTRTVGNALDALPSALGAVAQDVGGGVAEGAGNLGRLGQNELGLVEGAIRGTADLGKISSDIFKGRVLDPLRIHAMGADPGEVAQQRLLEDRKFKQDRQGAIDGSGSTYIQDLATVGLNALPFVDESTAVRLASKLEPPRKVAELASYVADPTAIVPGVAPLTKASKAAANVTNTYRKAHQASHLAKAGADVMLPKSTLDDIHTVANPSKSIPQRAVGAGASQVEKAAEVVEDLVDAAQNHTGKLRVAGAALGSISGPFGAVVGWNAPEMVSKASKVIESSRRGAAALRHLADADWASRVPVWMQIAKNPDAPKWIKKAVTFRLGGVHLAKGAEATVRAGSQATKGAAMGSAIGGGLMALDPNKTGEEIGSGTFLGAALGGAGGALGQIASRQQRMEVASAYDKLRFADRAIQDGADPGMVLSAKPAVLDTAVTLETLFQGAFPGGKSLSIKLVGPDHPVLGGQVAAFDAQTATAFLDVSTNDPDGRLLHETIGHGLVASVVQNKPNVIHTVETLLSPDALDQAKLDYAAAMGHKGSLAKKYIEFQNQHDPYWIHEEIFAEAVANTLRDQDLLAGVRSVLGRPGRLTFFKDQSVKDALTSRDMQNLVVEEFEALSGFRPGVDDAVERGAKLNTEMVGKHPAVPVDKLADGTVGNDFVTVTPAGQTVPRPQKQVRRIVRSRQAEMGRIFPDEAPVKWNEGGAGVRTRTTPSGLTRKTGRTLGERWYSSARSFSESAKAYARKIEEAIQSGTPLAGWYQQVIPRIKREIRDTLGGMEAQFKDFIPFEFWVDKKNNILVNNYSLTALHRKANEWATRKGMLSMELWDGDLGRFHEDVKTYLRNHAEGRPGADGIGETKRNVINAFLVGKNATFGEFNPLRDQLSGSDRTGIIRSYRLDRIQTVEPSELTGFEKPKYVDQLKNKSPALTEPGNSTKGIDNEQDSPTSIPPSRFRVDPVSGGLRFEEGIRRTAREHPLGAAVEVKPREFYVSRGTDLFLAPDGLAGTAVTESGDLVSVFKHPQSQQKVAPILLDASRVSSTLDAYDINGFLPDLYKGFGFKPAAIVRWNDEYAPPGWPYDKAGRPNVVLMVRDPNGVLPEFTNMNEVRDSLPIFDDWDDAAAVQQQLKDQVVAAGLPSYVRHSPEVQEAPVVSSRLPTAKKPPENPFTSVLEVGFDSFMKDRDAATHNLGLMKRYPNFPRKAGREKPEKTAERVINHMVKNLLWLHDNFDPEFRRRSTHWYPGGNDILRYWADQYETTFPQTAGVTAVLSPQKDWFVNMTLAERILDIWTQNQASGWSPEMAKTFDRIYPKSNPRYRTHHQVLPGKTLQELIEHGKQVGDFMDAAAWIRTFSETHHSPNYYILSPDGEVMGLRTNKDGETPANVQWSSNVPIDKSIRILLDGSVENISRLLGDKHKVRSFFNNLINPNSPHGFATIDTHAVAAALLRPLAGADREVSHNFGANVTGEPGPKNSSVTGANGTYGLYHEAYRRAAAERGLLPREMQSITWEAVRGLFQAKWKTKKNKVAVDEIWVKFKTGKITHDEAIKQINALAGGIGDPSWSGRSGQLFTEVGASTYPKELSGGSVSGGGS